MSTTLTLPLDALVRSVALDPAAGYTFFLGAGASVASGIPDADTCVWQWKRAIYLSNEAGWVQQPLDLTLPETRRRIQDWFDEQGGYPPPGTAEEYSFYAERCYPILDDRRRYFQRLSETAQPSVGYRLLCLLTEAGVVNAVWTTNFDGLLLKAAASSKVMPIAITLDGMLQDEWNPEGDLLYVALHGDYRFSALKNTSEELQEVDRTLRLILMEGLREQSLIVSGYSGRDKSVMAVLEEAYTQPGVGRLYWCGYQQPQPTPVVARLLETAQANGRAACYVPTQGFDDLLMRLASQCLGGDYLEQAQALRLSLSS